MPLWPHHGTSAADSQGRVWASPETCLLPEHPLRVVWRGWALSQTQLPSPLSPCAHLQVLVHLFPQFLEAPLGTSLEVLQAILKVQVLREVQLQERGSHCQACGCIFKGPGEGGAQGQMGPGLAGQPDCD